MKNERFKMKDIVIETIADLSDIKVSEINFISSFEELKIDNLDLVEIIMALEDKLEITIDNSMYNTKKVGELIEKLNKQINNKIQYEQISKSNNNI